MSKLIVPQWPQPKGVAACSSTRIGGVSFDPRMTHSTSVPIVAITRITLRRIASDFLLRAICLLNRSGLSRYTAKMCLSSLANLMPQNGRMPLIAIRGTVCAVMTADCSLCCFAIERERKSPPLMLAGVDCAQACWKRRFPVLLIIRKIFSPG